MCKRTNNGESRKSISQILRYAIYNRDACKCVYCGQQVIPGAHHSETTAAATLEHVTPWSKGGRDDETNLVTACAHCNFSRKNSTLKAFASRKGFNYKEILRVSRNRRARKIDRVAGKALMIGTKESRS
jgi:5-methylcytosine-specific restriction endonuclease McrA